MIGNSLSEKLQMKKNMRITFILNSCVVVGPWPLQVLLLMGLHVCVALMLNFGAKLSAGPSTKSFMFNTYGEHDATKLARGWVRKCNWLFERYLEGKSYTGYVEAEPWLEWALALPIESPSFDRVVELRAQAPQ